LHGFQVGYYMCATAQVLALKNDHEEAQKALKDAEDYGGNHEEFGYHLLAAGWQEIVSATLLEEERRQDVCQENISTSSF
jgi:hypothetical protein